MRPYSFEGRVALITGVSMKGLGLAYAEALAQRGCKVVVNDFGLDWEGNKVPDATGEVVNALTKKGYDVHGIAGDVVTEAADIVAGTLEQFGGLDILINNAGAGGSFDTQVDVHLRGTYNMSQAAWAALAESDAPRIVNVSSSGSFGSPAMPGYAAAKGGILSLTRTQALIGRADGIGVNCILPAAWTQSTEGIQWPGFAKVWQEHFPVRHVADFVLFLSHSNNQHTGEMFHVGGGLVTRIVHAESMGAVADEEGPEQWEALMDTVLDSDELTLSRSMWAHVGGFTKKLSAEAHEAFLALGIDASADGKLGS